MVKSEEQQGQEEESKEEEERKGGETVRTTPTNPRPNPSPSRDESKFLSTNHEKLVREGEGPLARGRSIGTGTQHRVVTNNANDDDDDDDDDDNNNNDNDNDEEGEKSRSLVQDEIHVRKEAKYHPLYLFVVHLYAAILVFVLYLITWQTIFGCALSVGLTLFTYYRADDTGKWDGRAMSWVLLSFAVVTPLIASIGMAFRRREESLRQIAAFRATAFELYLAHASWDWSGRSSSTVNWLHHCDRVLVELVAIGDELCRFLTLPTVSRARHRVTHQGQVEAARTIDVAYRLFHSLLTLRMSRVAKLCEVLKTEGLPPNEAIRIRQWERMVVQNAESLRMYKTYRTPQALRSFARLFAVFLPPFYAPYYAQLARDLNSLGMGITFSVFTTLALTSLFECVSVLEDPFVGIFTLDGIQVREELAVLNYQQLVGARELFFPDATPYAEEEERQRLLTGQRETDRGKKGKWHFTVPVNYQTFSPQGSFDAESNGSFFWSRTSSYASLAKQS